ncbi:hypothetical protein [Salinibacterium sp. ZJ77]|uniref:hypothetical protein n=1 Tax=Salinibacterium sp. ZJ77 TaxID=2708337 RepID=UPI001422F0DC|nr:hypothetical protein [Salinibacterium sp. ZJ77]
MAQLEGLRSYWWDSDPSEQSWVEIRKDMVGRPVIGTELRAPVLDSRGKKNPYYELLNAVQHGHRVYHWNSPEQRLVGYSTVSGRVRTDESLDPGVPWYRVDLIGFTPLDITVDAARLAAVAGDVFAHRERLRERVAGSLYLPFQYRADGIRFLSNYFAKLPNELIEILLGGPVHSSVPARASGFTGGYLQPFAAKSEGKYLAHVPERHEHRSRSHETLVNEFSAWLTSLGYETARNRAIDLAIRDPSVVIEAKWVDGNWAGHIRAAVGQLYEYRYFQLVSNDSRLVALFNEEPDRVWVDYLEKDRAMGVAWMDGLGGFELSRLAKAAIPIER